VRIPLVELMPDDGQVVVQRLDIRFEFGADIAGQEAQVAVAQRDHCTGSNVSSGAAARQARGGRCVPKVIESSRAFFLTFSPRIRLVSTPLDDDLRDETGVLESEDGDRIGGPRSLTEDKRMAHVRDTGERRRVRSLFVSDVHLGSRFAQAEAFLTFLEAYQPDYLYIVGDFLDGWSLQRSWYWRPVNTRILQHLLAWAWAGVTIR
jgi:hypothetical protein